MRRRDLQCSCPMGTIAGRTRRIKFGVNVIAAAMRDPVVLATQCAASDVLSERRMLPCTGRAALAAVAEESEIIEPARQLPQEEHA